VNAYAEIEKREVPCPVCQGRAFRTLASQDRYMMGLTTVGCTGCGLMMTNPMPTPAALTDFYRRHYRSLYRKVDVPTPEYIRELGLDRRARYTADVLTNADLFRPSARILDVGCAEGSLLLELRRRCPTVSVTGIEPGEGFARYCRDTLQLNVFGSLEALPEAAAAPYDVIISIHVLEHVEHPVAFLKSLRPLLKPAGIILIDVPDAAAYASLNDIHLAHLYHFSVHTLARTAREAGFFVVRIDRHRPPHHPPSIRALLSVEDPETEVIESPDERETVFRRMEYVGRKVLSYRLKRSVPGRILSRFWKGLRRILAPFRS
jgi:2-polyprenyl-3-methyl-5-hydroxy-6-metoxy-1,4-benzoquinol methylase